MSKSVLIINAAENFNSTLVGIERELAKILIINRRDEFFISTVDYKEFCWFSFNPLPI
jgi:hypothetical protein